MAEDFMTYLIATNNHIVLTKIFLFLDNQSLKTARCVCSNWNDYIKQNIWNNPFYRDVLRNRLENRWNQWWPLETITNLESTNVFDLAADKTDLAVSLESGQIEIWQKLGGQKKVVIQGLSHGLKIGLAKSFIVGGFFNHDLSIWNRLTGDLMTTTRLNSNIFSLVLSQKAKVIAVSKVNGEIDIFRWDDDNPSKHLNLNLVETLRGSSRSHYHVSISPCGQWLLYAARRRPLVLFDLNQMKDIFSLRNDKRVYGVQIAYPIALQETTLDEGGLLIWHLVNGKLLKRIPIHDIQNFSLNDNRIVILTKRKLLMIPIKEVYQDPLTTDLDRSSMVTIWSSSESVRPQENSSNFCPLILEYDQIMFPVANGVVNLNFWKAEKTKSCQIRRQSTPKIEAVQNRSKWILSECSIQ